jgi:hypothetical protein
MNRRFSGLAFAQTSVLSARTPRSLREELDQAIAVIVDFFSSLHRTQGVGDPLEGPFNLSHYEILKKLDEARIGGYRARTAFSKSHLSGPTCHASRNIPSSVGNSLNTAATSRWAGRYLAHSREIDLPSLAMLVGGTSRRGPIPAHPDVRFRTSDDFPHRNRKSAKLLNCVRIAHGPQGPST